MTLIFGNCMYILHRSRAVLSFESLYVSRITLRDRNQWQHNITASGTLFAPSQIGQYNIAPEIEKIFVELCTFSIKLLIKWNGQVIYTKSLVLVFNRGHCEVSTGSSVEAMSLPFTKSPAATAESFMVTSPRCFPYTITWTEESTCNAGHGVGTWSAERHWEADPTTAGRGHF